MSSRLDYIYIVSSRVTFPVSSAASTPQAHGQQYHSTRRLRHSQQGFQLLFGPTRRLLPPSFPVLTTLNTKYRAHNISFSHHTTRNVHPAPIEADLVYILQHFPASSYWPHHAPHNGYTVSHNTTTAQHTTLQLFTPTSCIPNPSSTHHKTHNT